MKNENENEYKEFSKSDMRWIRAAGNGNQAMLCELLGPSGILRKDEVCLGTAALFRAAKAGQLGCVKLLAKAGASVSAGSGGSGSSGGKFQIKCGMTPTMIAARMGQLKVLEFLIDSGADIHMRGPGGYDAVFWAAESDQPQALALLIKAGAPPETEGTNGFTAVMAAADAGSYDCLLILQAAGADLTRKQILSGWSAAHHAADSWMGSGARSGSQDGCGRCLELAIRAGCDPTVPDLNGTTMDVIARGSPECLNVLSGERARREAAELDVGVNVRPASKKAPGL